MSRFPELTSEELSGCVLCCWDKLLPWSCLTSIEQPCDTGSWGMFWGQEMLFLIPGGWCAGLIPDWTICRWWTFPDTWHPILALKHLRELLDPVVGEKQGCRLPWVNCLATRLALLETGEWEILDSCSRTGGSSGFVWAGFEEPLGARGLPIWQADKTPGFLGGWASCLPDIWGWERERCCKLHKPFQLWPLVSKWSYS